MATIDRLGRDLRFTHGLLPPAGPDAQVCWRMHMQPRNEGRVVLTIHPTAGDAARGLAVRDRRRSWPLRTGGGPSTGSAGLGGR